MIESFLKFFVVFFLVVEPISLVPVFASLTEGASAQYRRRMAIKSVIVAGMIILGFALSGAAFLGAMGISIDLMVFGFLNKSKACTYPKISSIVLLYTTIFE